MEKLTNKEEEVMQILWDIEKGFVKDVIEKMKKPKAPYTTISSIIRILENKGFVGHKAFGNTHEYFPLISKPDYRRHTFKNLVNKYFDNSVKNVVSFLIKEEKLSDKQIEELYSLIKESHPKKK
jgi:BlaI family transcriptional regulator, penicillinase repressor